MKSWIKVGNIKYHWYDDYYSKKTAIKVAKVYNKKNRRNKYTIIEHGGTFLFPQRKYTLYMTKVKRIMG